MKNKDNGLNGVSRITSKDCCIKQVKIKHENKSKFCFLLSIKILYIEFTNKINININIPNEPTIPNETRKNRYKLWVLNAACPSKKR